jgi:beta-phosphoglucomutase-like phosphatase (HAD superfamily)
VSASPVAAVIFDFDGVLADTERLHLAAFRRVFLPRGWDLDEATYFERYLGCDDRGLVESFGRDRGLAIPAADVRTLVDAKGRAFAELVGTGQVMFASTAACVERLAARFPLAIASGALRDEIEAILLGAGLLAHFRTIVAADDVRETKPSPEPYATAASRLGVPPGACVAVEDSAPGLASARAAGMRTISITTTSPRHLLLAGSDRVIDDLAELTVDVVSTLGTPAGL